jgi:hypothetical protein
MSTECVYISRDIVFDENVFPFSELHKNVDAQLHAEIFLLPPPLRNFHGHDVVDNHRAYGTNPGVEVVGVQVEEITGSANVHQGMLGIFLDESVANPAATDDPLP